ncbi:MAG: glycerophosphodiester phosphodiesterase family protein [Verrucomicrobia bacterium]|nr:glycerophosphodiester phosphodiesterase family protein [Verrucomicrobiota bacterium]
MSMCKSNNITERAPAQTLCIGHRGAAGHAPENTLASIRKAIQLGADWIEIDVHLCEQQLVVIHDFTLERTTNGRGPVNGFSLSYLRALDAGNGEQIPLLQEVLQLLPEPIGINIELKGVGTAEPVASLLKTLSTTNVRNVLVSSFDWPQLEAVRACAPTIPVAPLTKDDYANAVQFAASIEAHGINVGQAHLSAAQVNDARRRGLKIFTYTPNSDAEFCSALKLGVDGIITDYPDRLRKHLDLH